MNPKKVMKSPLYKGPGSLINGMSKNPSDPLFMLFVTAKRTKDIRLAVTGWGLRSKGSRTEVKSIEVPIRVSTPNITLSSNRNSRVTTVIRIPQRETITPFLTGFPDRLQEKPDMKIKHQQMLCCQIYAGKLVYQGMERPAIYFRSQHR